MNQLVHQSGDRLIVTTLEISNRFGKRHDDVLRAIKNLECSQEFSRRNFAGTSYNDSQNKPRPMYEITRDGFTFLCMGFTGSQAALWKERYIEAFNQMEAVLHIKPTVHHQQIALATQVGQLTDMVRSRDAIITATDSVIMGLQDRLIGSQGRQIRLIGQVASMQKRQRDREIIQLIERMEIEGKPRSDIVAMTGKPSNYIRQRLLIARREGRITTPQGSLNLEGGAA